MVRKRNTKKTISFSSQSNNYGTRIKEKSKFSSFSNPRAEIDGKYSQRVDIMKVQRFNDRYSINTNRMDINEQAQPGSWRSASLVITKVAASIECIALGTAGTRFM